MAEALQAAACSAPQPPPMQGCGVLVPGEEKGKPDWKDPAPKTSLAAVAPVRTSPCGPCGPACCWTSLSLHGSPVLGLPLHSLSMVCLLPCPSWCLLLKSSCAKASSRGCCFGLPGGVTLAAEVVGITWDLVDEQRGPAGQGRARRHPERDSGCSVPCCTHRCLRQGQPSHASTACRKLQEVRSKPCGDSYQISSLLHHNSTIFFVFLGPPGTRVGPIATGCAWDSL